MWIWNDRKIKKRCKIVPIISGYHFSIKSKHSKAYTKGTFKGMTGPDMQVRAYYHMPHFLNSLL